MTTVKEMLKGKWIVWRFKERTTPHFSKDRVQDITETNSGLLLELTGNCFDTKYPNRILLNEIEYLLPVNKDK